jgi:hypothetical protein
VYAVRGLEPEEEPVVRAFVRRIRHAIPAVLVQASLFGSRARGEARLDSDVDVLLVFQRLPPDREPHATMAEVIAADVANASGVPLNVWSISLADLGIGRRTPMLVDALEDSVPLWCSGTPVGTIPFTLFDASCCCEKLLVRVDEGSAAFGEACHQGRWDDAARRSRDDIVRLCAAGLLLRGVTRPRRADSVRRFAELAAPGHPEVQAVLGWTVRSFGPDGRNEDRPVPFPPGGARAVAWTIDYLRTLVIDAHRRFQYRAMAHHRSLRVPSPPAGHLSCSIGCILIGACDRFDTCHPLSRSGLVGPDR